MGIPKTTQREDCGTRRKPQQPHFPHPRRICLTDSLIPADTSDRERRKARGLGYPTATRLAPADLPERRGNGATLLMLPPRGPREVARGGKPRGECLLQTSGRAERHTILAILDQSRAQTDLIRTRRERSVARSRSNGKHRGSGAIDPPLAVSGVNRRGAVGHPTRCLVHHARGLLLPAREAFIGASNERDFQTSRNVRLRGTPIGPDAARRQPTRTWHYCLACALHTDPPGPLRACTCKTNPALAPNAHAPAVQTRATRLTTGHKSIPARPGYAPSRLTRPRIQ